jgi:hypothetical protein
MLLATAGQGAAAGKPLPAEVVCSLNIPALGSDTGSGKSFLSRSTVVEVTFGIRDKSPFNGLERIQMLKEQSQNCRCSYAVTSCPVTTPDRDRGFGIYKARKL